jgi:hypothetical protein
MASLKSTSGEAKAFPLGTSKLEILGELVVSLLPSCSPAILALADGTVFKGQSIGADGVTSGEVVFNTAMSGYQEILTDPAYSRQIVPEMSTAMSTSNSCIKRATCSSLLPPTSKNLSNAFTSLVLI